MRLKLWWLKKKTAKEILTSAVNRPVSHAWERIVEVHKTGEVITGTVTSKTKGGLIVDVFGMETFLPGSQIDVKPVTDYDQFVGKTMEFKVVKINEAIKNAVVSHKALIESDIEAQRARDHEQTRKRPGSRRFYQEYHRLWCVHGPWRP